MRAAARRTGPSSTPRLLVKRDDAIPLGFGGNKIRKLQVVAAQALAAGRRHADHHRRRAVESCPGDGGGGRALGLHCVLVANGAAQERPTANALLDRLLGAEVRYVATREARGPAMEDAADELRARGRRPFVIPLGASTPHGAAAYAAAVGEVLAQIDPPDVILLSTSSGGTQAGIIAGCALHGLATRVIGISADDPAPAIAARIRRNLAGLEDLLGTPARWRGRQSRSTTRASAADMAFRRRRPPRRSSCVPERRRSFSIPPTRRRRWPVSSPASGLVRRTVRCSSGIQADRWDSSLSVVGSVIDRLSNMISLTFLGRRAP